MNIHQVAYNAKRRHNDLEFNEKQRNNAKLWYEQNREKESLKRVLKTQTRTVTDLVDKLSVLNVIGEELVEPSKVVSSCIELLNTKTIDGDTTIYMLAIQSSRSKSVCAVATYQIISILLASTADGRGGHEITMEHVSQGIGVSAASLTYSLKRFEQIEAAVKSGTEKELQEYTTLKNKRKPSSSSGAAADTEITEEEQNSSSPQSLERNAFFDESEESKVVVDRRQEHNKSAVVSSLIRDILLLQNSSSKEKDEKSEPIHTEMAATKPEKASSSTNERVKIRLVIENDSNTTTQSQPIMDFQKTMHLSTDLMLKLCSFLAAAASSSST